VSPVLAVVWRPELVWAANKRVRERLASGEFEDIRGTDVPKPVTVIGAAYYYMDQANW
jgi:hypothetical protein